MEKLSKLNCYQRQICQYIEDYHPQLLNNREELKETIIRRANQASAAYIESLERGEPEYEAKSYANEILHAGLEFSPVMYIKELYEEKKGVEIENKQAIAIYDKTKKIFLQYGQDFEGTEAEIELQEKIIEFLQKKIKK